MRIRGFNIWLPSEIMTKLVAEKQGDEQPIDTLHRLLDLQIPERKPKQPLRKVLNEKYDVSDLQVGQSKLIAYRRDENGMGLDQRPILNSIRNFSKKTNRIFRTRAESGGLRVTRLE